MDMAQLPPGVLVPPSLATTLSRSVRLAPAPKPPDPTPCRLPLDSKGGISHTSVLNACTTPTEQTAMDMAQLPPGVLVPLEFRVLVSVLSTAQLQYTAFCVFVTTLLEPLVLSHADGDTHIGIPICGEAGDSRGRNDRLLEQAEKACRSVLPKTPPILVPAGLTHAQGSPVVAAPVALVPPSQMVARSPRQRRSLLTAGATFVFMTVAALAGTPAYHIAAPALARINSFVRPAADLKEAMLAGAVVSDALRFHFGGREVAGRVS